MDASAYVELLWGTALGDQIKHRLRGESLLAPAHFDAEVLSALGRLQRAGDISAPQVDERIRVLAKCPVMRTPLPPLLKGAWERRNELRLLDALYVELAASLDAFLITSDSGMAARYGRAELFAKSI